MKKSIASITMSTNAFQFIRQCRYERQLPSNHRILQEAQKSGVEGLYDHVHFLIGTGGDINRIQAQRALVRDMMRDALGKILYTQEKFAGSLIALSKEFGVAVAIKEFIPHPFDDNNGKWEVTVYGPELWGKRFEFDDYNDALAYATEVNAYGDFTLI